MEWIKDKLSKVGATRLFMTVFVLILLVAMPLAGISTTDFISNVLVRIGMNGIMVLAMLTSILCGAGVNYGLPIGILSGLLGGVLSLEWNLTGWLGFSVAILISVPVAAIFGWLYGILLNNVKGSEGTIGTYVGYSITAFFCILWLALPFKNPAILWSQGAGVRNAVAVTQNYEKILDGFLAFRIGPIRIPTGLLLAFCGLCLIIWLFTRSRTGLIMRTVGQNPLFAAASGVNVNKYRILGVLISSVLAAIGIIVYSQSYGFYNLYLAPQKMAFPAIAAVLIGGASNRKVSISNVVIGVILYQCMITFAPPVANAVLPSGNVTEVVRMLISNGVILIALTKEAKK